ncbi:MAG: hypothetical protein SPLUMA1_SPLUMAMAG1_01540 [uncultured Sulfurimonas sp.]|nr:MAG: hypothetical protein SPLUMA1_SPLUMAMAG1_01540 [uncultured Sulfurimonas sp.]
MLTAQRTVLLQDTYEKTATGFGLDLGVNYHSKFMREWKPAIGLSIMNIGAMDMEGNYGYQPMTVNVGISLSQSIPYLEEIVFAADYVDIFNANTIRIYDYPDSSTGTTEIKYTDYTDSDFMKCLRLGVGLTLIDSQYFSTTLNGGLYQGAYTAGLNMELLILKLNLATYEEQVGTDNIDIKDRRYMAQVEIGW